MENAIEVRQQQPAREIGVITAEIKELRKQAQTMALLYAVEIGRRLDEAKHALPHGAWGEWLRNEVEFSQSSANNFMRLYDEYGSAQTSLFGAQLNSQTFANLPYSKALLLIAVPSEEREEFAENVHADELSVKELKAAIEERDKALKMAEMQKQLKDEAYAKYKEAEAAAQDALKKASDAEHLAGELEHMTQQVNREKAAADELREKLREAEKNPKIPKATLDKLRKEAEAAAKKAAEEKTQKELEEARKKAEKATAEAIKAKNAEAAAKASLAEAERKLKTANPDVAAFKALFDDVQSAAAKLRGMIGRIRETDPETADKLGKALKAFGSSL